MCIGNGYALICLDSIRDEEERNLVKNSLLNDGLAIIEISQTQLEENFAGNMLQVQNDSGELFLVMSANACASLTSLQKETLLQHVQIIAPAIPTIETVGGGSARCMMAVIFLPPLQTAWPNAFTAAPGK